MTEEHISAKWLESGNETRHHKQWDYNN